jgi:serpin B
VLDTLAGLDKRLVTLSFPKAKLVQTFQLRTPLEALGMKSAFAGSADFSALSKSLAMNIASVQQQTFLDLDEGGTEAAAVTTVGFEATSAPEPPKTVIMNVDRPYIMAIVDRQTKTLLFLGRILEPKG